MVVNTNKIVNECSVVYSLQLFVVVSAVGHRCKHGVPVRYSRLKRGLRYFSSIGYTRIS